MIDFNTLNQDEKKWIAEIMRAASVEEHFDLDSNPSPSVDALKYVTEMLVNMAGNE